MKINYKHFLHYWSVLFLVAMLAVVFVVPCAVTADDQDSTPALTIVSIVVTLGNPECLAIGNTQQCTATAVYSDGSVGDVSSQAKWASSNFAVATVDPSGLITGIAVGDVNVTASISGISTSEWLSVETGAAIQAGSGF